MDFPDDLGSGLTPAATPASAPALLAKVVWGEPCRSSLLAHLHSPSPCGFRTLGCFCSLKGRNDLLLSLQCKGFSVLAFSYVLFCISKVVPVPETAACWGASWEVPQTSACMQESTCSYRILENTVAEREGWHMAQSLL